MMLYSTEEHNGWFLVCLSLMLSLLSVWEGQLHRYSTLVPTIRQLSYGTEVNTWTSLDTLFLFICLCPNCKQMNAAGERRFWCWLLDQEAGLTNILWQVINATWFNDEITHAIEWFSTSWWMEWSNSLHGACQYLSRCTPSLQIRYMPAIQI